MTTLNITSFGGLKEYMDEVHEIKIPDYTTAREIKEKLKDVFPEIMDLIDKSRFVAGDRHIADHDYITDSKLLLLPPLGMV